MLSMSASVNAADPGMLIMTGLPGTTLDRSTLKLINERHISNFILFKRNVSSPRQLRSLCSSLEDACLEAGLGGPLIAIDQEGGTVSRLPPPFAQFPGAREMSETTNPEESVSIYAETCATELKNYGINMNLAPVLDVSPAGKGFFMEDRVLGSDPLKVGRLGRRIIQIMQNLGVAACGKHFPGLGSATVDPHLQLPRVDQSAALQESRDLEPFVEAISSGVASIMTSHAVYPQYDKNNPGTLSGLIMEGLLRDNLKYDGVLITDDLEMGAIVNHEGVGVAALKAFLAGSDILLICHDHKRVVEACDTIQGAVDDRVIPSSRLSDSARRIKEVKNRFTVQL